MPAAVDVLRNIRSAAVAIASSRKWRTLMKRSRVATFASFDPRRPAANISS
eukprot:CAMPEP_0172900012 /NCGR_PEP_ID=MMETSP1075-20121228/163151_1 /TAXON_ID=2916 /ORGANISM="Ceratium fusus, Strain PA161109" /LENGTH=50 /DNA_ID=CAMNT_0013756115 /DNA_START=101 /DNA_END=253 /DNA_ORIENTATION=-